MLSRIFIYRSISRRSISTVSDLYQGLINGDRSCLAQSITLVESTRAEKQHRAKELLSKVLEGLKQRTKPISFRIGWERLTIIEFMLRNSSS